LPRQGHHLADELFVRFRKNDACRPASPPCAALGSKHRWEIPHEGLLLLRWELHHAVARIAVNRRKYAILDSEVRMAHVRAFHGVGKRQRDATELVVGQRSLSVAV